MKRETLVQLALAFLLVSALLTGITAAVAPHTFYGDFPFLRHWVDLLPPYNEHLVTDVGELYLGFAVLFGWALWTLEPTLVRAVCTAWLVPSVLHLIFHATHLDNFDTGDAVAEIASLALVVLPAALALWAIRGNSEGGQNHR